MGISVTLVGGRISFKNGCTLSLSLDHGNSHVNGGAIVLLQGPNGSGKSTFLRAISGVYEHYFDSGNRPELDQLAVWRKDDNAVEIMPRSTPYGENTSLRGGFLSQSPRSNVFCENVEDEVAFSLEHSGIEPDDIRTRLEVTLSELDSLGIERSVRPHRLSKGQQQLLGFVSLAEAEPDVLFLDEPTACLDDRALEWFVQKVFDLVHREKVQMVFVASQDTRLADRLSGNSAVETLLVSGSLDSASGKRSDSIDIVELGEFERSTVLLKEIKCARDDDFTVELPTISLSPGEMLLISGANGTGKSTLVEAIAGYRPAKKGEIHFGSKVHLAGRRSYKSKVAYAFQNADEQILFNACDREISHPPKYAGWASACSAQLVKSGIDMASNPWHLSLGQRKLLTYYSLAFSSSIWVIDEPFASLDDDHRREVSALIEVYLNAGGIVVITNNHAHPELDGFVNCQRVLLDSVQSS